MRVERLQDIDDDDHGYSSNHSAVPISGWAKENFSELWDSIDAKRSYSWESNPWVWVVDFKLVATGGIPVTADQLTHARVDASE